MKPAKGFVKIIRKEIKSKAKQVEKDNILPPSNYFVLDSGDSVFEKGCEVLMRSSALLSHIQDEKEHFIIDQRDIIAFK